MRSFEECCVLIPAATLEDFPNDLSDSDARSLLAAWTVLWHPQLLAATRQLPSWSRADSPPEPKAGSLIVVPAPSLGQLPADFQSRVAGSVDCHLISGGSRDELLTKIGQCEAAGQTPKPPEASPSEASPQQSLQPGGQQRRVGVEDFYAAGYAALQIQVMTRRLRYTSNLDEIHLQNRVIQAAESYIGGDAKAAIAALHDVFDCLAEERDHYFSSSDSHLIDLTLVTPSTVEGLLDDIDALQEVDGSDDQLATPRNFLLDQAVADVLHKLSARRLEKLRRLIAANQVGWAGGGPPANVCLDTMTFAGAEQAIAQATTACVQAVARTPTVFGRFSGGWHGDLTGVLVRLGYQGVLPIDFAAGSGHGEEAKVLLQTGGAQIEALTAKPIDASSDAAFLTLGTRLGESIDSGEIASALLAHWPGAACDSFSDLRRASTWSLCLGRFWKLGDYFAEGEHPYHHGNIPAVSKSAADVLDSIVDQGDADPISNLARHFRATAEQEQQQIISGIADLVAGTVCQDDNPVARLGRLIAGGDRQPHSATVLINPQSVGLRRTVNIDHPLAAQGAHVFAVSEHGSQSEVTVDVPACGFVLLAGEGSAARHRRSFTQRIRSSFAGDRRSIASKDRSDGSLRLQNEFMEVVLSQTSGGVSGVYSGAIRGNRFSMKLVHQQSELIGHQAEAVMHCDSIKIVSSSAATASIEATGSLKDPQDQQSLAEFVLRYTLDRGSRVLQVNGQLKPRHGISGAPWRNYFAARAAVAGEAAIYRPLIRDKLHRGSSRRIVAPLGVLIDEAERQTLIGSRGLAFHRQVADRFLDTLLAVEHESQFDFQLCYGFDVPSPVAMAQSLIAPPPPTEVAAATGAAAIGWIIHPAPKTVIVSGLSVNRRVDGRLAALIRLTQTRSQPCKAAVRFLRDVDAAILLSESSDDPLNRSVPAAEDRARLETEGDRVSLPMPGHAVIDLLVIFRDSDST